MSRRDLSALRQALATVRAGLRVAATFRTPDDGRFTVTGPVRADLTGTTLKVGWSDLTTGAAGDPVPELQALAPVDPDEEPRSDGHELIDELRPGDVVTAEFDFEGAGRFTIQGGVRRDDSGTRWVVAGHHLTHGSGPASRLRHLSIDRTVAEPAEPVERYDLFGS